ncbi:MAG: hypothetical protein DRI81_20010 [Chloroflexi bacterium]|nr:MAG: hypothetical protein DRI81_20010 [Chloroflexota bacterium]
MSVAALKTIVGTTLIDREFCEELLNGNRLTLLAEFNLTDEEHESILAIKANYPRICDWGLQVADKLGELDFSLHTLPEGEAGQKHSDEELSDTDAFLIECLAWGLLQVHDIKAPPVDVREILEHPLPIFKRLTLLELSLGLYDAAYRSCLDGSRLIVVDPTRDRVIQRAGMARELYVAFCHSQRATELHWPRREQPHAYSDFFRALPVDAGGMGADCLCRDHFPGNPGCPL